MSELTAVGGWSKLPWSDPPLWTRGLSDGSWLMAGCLRRGQWLWAHRGPDYVGEADDRQSRIRANGSPFRTARDAKAAADAYLEGLA